MDLSTISEQFHKLKTPFYYYDTALLNETIAEAKRCASIIPEAAIHFAVKANSHPTILKKMQEAGFGADCVSGGEIVRCIEAGIPGPKIMYAGVGKTEEEIRLGIEKDICCFNAESMEEIHATAKIAQSMGKIARIAIRVNPNVDAHTHKNITTGLEENKFGISMDDLVPSIRMIKRSKALEYYGLHFHIGSQILQFDCFKELCSVINKLQKKLENQGIISPSINVGGGLGIDYIHPERHPVPDFRGYFNVFAMHLKLRTGQTLHFELGRALSAQWGSLITKTLYVKRTKKKKFAIVDAGFTDLIRPALYQAYHKIENIDNSTGRRATYDVVGPICESSDVFSKDIKLNTVYHGNLLAIRSAGAYGAVMASQYNCRKLPKEYTTEDLLKLKEASQQ